MTNIFVGNLSYRTTHADINCAFAAYGNVERVNIVTDRDAGQARGFAFVEMTEPLAAQTAISHLNGAELHGRTLNVNEARPKPTGGSYGGSGMIQAAIGAEDRRGKIAGFGALKRLMGLLGRRNLDSTSGAVPLLLPEGAGHAGSWTTDFQKAPERATA